MSILLVRKNNLTDRQKKGVPRILCREKRPQEFKNCINRIPDYKDFYTVLKVRKGSTVKIRSDREFAHGYVGLMKDMIGSTQIIKELDLSIGKISFEEANFQGLRYTYNLSDVAEVLKY